MSRKKRLLVLTSGGDSPGMNAAIRAVVRSSCYRNLEVFACHDGYLGLVERQIFPIDTCGVSGCIQCGGTILRAGRAKHFHNPEVRNNVVEFLQQQKIDFLVPIGGDGTFRGAALLEKEGGPKCIGIPGTIDNDIVGTEYTIGYDTARNNALRSIDKIRDTSASSGMYFLVETMGRNAGFLAVDIGLASGAEFIVTPEYPISVPDIAAKILNPVRKRHSVLIVIAEADRPGRSFDIAKALELLTPEFSYRVCVLGHVQRGGQPTAQDRLVASIMGDLAVKGLLEGKSLQMTALNNNKYCLVDLPSPDKSSRCLTDQELLQLNAVLSV